MFGSTGYVNSEVMSEAAATSEFDIDIDSKDCVLIDPKGMFNRKESEDTGFEYWRL
jgi:UDP-N-acetyl-D-galactosamine dehydrogenase